MMPLRASTGSFLSGIGRMFAALVVFVFCTVFGVAKGDGEIAGHYAGSVFVADSGITIPLEMVVTLSDAPPPSNPGGPIDLKKTFNVAFMVDSEGGPFKANNAIFDISNGRFEINYYRSGNAVGGIPNLRFSGTLSVDDGTFSGTLFSGTTGTIGSFSLERTGGVRPLIVKHKYVGSWGGTFQFTGGPSAGQTATLSIQLAPSPATYTNPTNYDLEFTAGKVGGFDLDGLQLGFSSVTIDYFHRKMILTYQSNARLEIFCDLLDDGSLQGVVNATFTGQTGTFVIPKLQ